MQTTCQLMIPPPNRGKMGGWGGADRGEWIREPVTAPKINWRSYWRAYISDRLAFSVLSANLFFFFPDGSSCVQNQLLFI